MKFIHTADLHLGKRYAGLSLCDDQKYILDEMLKVVDREKPDAFIIAGDVYDKSVPPESAVELFDGFLSALAKRGVKVFIAYGNHDSAERLAFGASLMSPCGVHVSPIYTGVTEPIALRDEFGSLNVYLLPFIKPATVKRFLGEDISTYTQAVAAAIENMKIDPSARNVLVAHQFVTGSLSSGSEEFTVGDVGNVDLEVFKDFDYVALGHIHGAQNVSKDGRVRYSGTPLKYSLSEKDNKKSLTIVELKGKGDLKITQAPLTPMRDVKEIRGTYDEITNRAFYENKPFRGDLLHVVLTDEDEVYDAIGKLRIIYPNVMSIRYDNARTKSGAEIEDIAEVASRSPAELFSALYEMQNNRPLSDEQTKIVASLIEKVWGDEQ
ncbi:MAG: exonuclease SbcCD subunit D [Clostridia bacterium]|nr:exonuclease SbcCD subunit D [Clostridia bacterium]